MREAVAGLILVPTADDVPGATAFARLDDLGFVAAADQPEVVALVYQVLRELVSVVTARQTGAKEVDLNRVELHLQTALTALAEFAEVGKFANQAEKNLQNLKDAGNRVHARLRDALTSGLAEVRT